MSTKLELKGKFYVTICEAKDLVDPNLFGTMDPYVEIECCKDKFKTKVHQDGGKAPKWDAAFVFNLDGKQADDCHVAIYHKGLVTDTKVGRCDLSIQSLCEDGKEHWYQVVDPSNFKKMAGQIKISAKFEGTGLPQKQTTTTASTTTASTTTAVQQPRVVVVQQPVQQPQVVYQQQVQQPQVMMTSTGQLVYVQQQPQVVYQQQPQVVYTTQGQQVIYR
jgi:Ca2+-dependent lipid-binding protein